MGGEGPPEPLAGRDMDADVDADAEVGVDVDRDARPDRAPQAPPLPQPALLLQMTRACLWVAALAGVAGAVLLGATLQPAPTALRFAVLYGAFALLAAAGTRAPERFRSAAATLLSALLVLLLAGTAHALGWGLASPTLPIAGLTVCVLCAVASWRAGAVVAALAAACVLAIDWLSRGAGTAMLSVPARPILLGTHLIAIGAGLCCGALISNVMSRYLRQVHSREQRFTRLLALAADAYWELDAHYHLLAADAPANEGKGGTGGGARTLSLHRALGRLPWELPQFGCDPERLDELLADMDTRVPFRDLPVRWTTADGSVRDYRISGEPRFDDRGVFTGYWGVARDVSAMQHAHAALRATETRYQELFSRIPTPLVLHRGGFVIDANPAALALLGVADLQTMLSRDLLALYQSGDSRERERRRLEQLQGQGLGAALPVADFRLDVAGRVVSVRATSVVVDADGGPALLSIFVDDTERLAAEEAVRRSEALLSHLVATSPDLITLTDLRDGRHAMVNDSFERVTGYAAAEVVGRTAQELGLWASDAQREGLLQALREQGVVTELATQFISKRGTPVSMTVSAARFAMDRRDYMVINARDVTQRDRQRLEREAILANASIGIAFTRGQRFVLTNRHFEQMFGWGEGALIGQPGAVIWASPADHAAVGATLSPALARGEAVELEHACRRMDGSRFMARIRGQAIDAANPRDGGTVWIIEDVTERRQFERALARARDDAEAASRAKSAFLANTSHELQTPLNGMIGLARLARDDNAGAEARRGYLDQIVHSAQALAAIISDILDLSKIEAGKLLIDSNGVFDLAAELHGLHRQHAAAAQAQGVQLRLALQLQQEQQPMPEVRGSAATLVQGDALRVRQIIGHFLANALKFAPHGDVVLRARRLAGDAAPDNVRIEVQDSGPGIDAAVSARLFKPFTQADDSSTRRFGGAGLGLAISHELARLMGGRVGLDSAVGGGSTFWVELPLPPVAQAAQAAAAAAVGPTLAGARVLMVEDNPVNMMIAVAMLERWGVQVAQAHDGREAVAAVQAAADAQAPFHAVLMDVQMPRMSGHQATAALRQAGHALPIVALTAAALVSEREAALAAGMNDFLTKPIDADRLHATLLRWCAAP